MAQVTDVLSNPTGESRYANMLQVAEKLLSAAREGDIAAVRRLLAEDRDVVNVKNLVCGWR